MTNKQILDTLDELERLYSEREARPNLKLIDSLLKTFPQLAQALRQAMKEAEAGRKLAEGLEELGEEIATEVPDNEHQEVADIVNQLWKINRDQALTHYRKQIDV